MRDSNQDRYLTTWRVLDGIVACCGTVLLAGEWFTALTAVVVGGHCAYGAITGKNLLKWRYRKVDWLNDASPRYGGPFRLPPNGVENPQLPSPRAR